MERISIQEIAAVLIAKNGLKKKEAERFVTALFDVVKDGLESERLVKIKGLGTFKIIDIEARESVNVNTGERVVIEGHDKITFTPDAAMKELVNKPFSQFETVVLNDGVEFDDMDAAASEPSEESEEMLVEEPVVEGSVVKDLVAEDLVAEDLVAEEPVAEEPVVEGSVAEEPVAEEPVAEEPVAEEPIVEEAVVEESVLEVEASVQKLVEHQEEKVESNNHSDAMGSQVMEETEKKSNKSIIWVLVAIAACIGSFAAGYYMGRESRNADADLEVSQSVEIEQMDSIIGAEQKEDSAVVAAKSDTTDVVAETDTTAATMKADTVAVAVKSDAATDAVKTDAATTAEKKDAVVPKKDDPSESSSASMDKYAQMDARVRTGAYRIVGDDYEVKVRAGETLKRIAQRTLGPDMECYIEVYNGIKSNSELKAGQSVKIPKLKLKKKKKSTN